MPSINDPSAARQQAQLLSARLGQIAAGQPATRSVPTPASAGWRMRAIVTLCNPAPELDKLERAASGEMETRP